MKISVIGLGKLGSPLAAVLASKGHKIIGVDINPLSVSNINQGIAPVSEPGLQELISKFKKNLSATLSVEEAVLNSDATFLILPTPSNSDGFFSNQLLISALDQIGKALKKKNSYHLVVITSTVMPGSSQGVLKDQLESSSQKKVGIDIGLCYNPEFIALGSVIRNMQFPDMILIGESDKKAGDLLESICLSICEKNPPVRRMNLVNAELTKISINTYVTTKISYANMLSDLCDRIPNADVDVVTDALGLDSRIGPKYLKAATSFGGPCFPRDNIAFAALAKSLEARADLAIATQEINDYQIHRLYRAVKKHTHIKKIGILGLSYKAATHVVEESPGIRIANQLVQEDYEVFAHDPIALSEAKKCLDPRISLQTDLSDCIENVDALVFMIPWPDYKKMERSLLKNKVVIDFWRLFSSPELETLCTLVHPGCSNETLTLV